MIREFYSKNGKALTILVFLAAICAIVYAIEALDESHNKSVNKLVARDEESEKKLIDTLMGMRKTAVEDRDEILAMLEEIRDLHKCESE